MVQLDYLAVVLFGILNIGKLLIVRAICCGMPEVNIYPFMTHGVMLGHERVFWESEREVTSGNVAGISIPRKRKFIHERLVKGCKDKKKEKIDNGDVRDEKRQLGNEGGEGLVRVDIDDDNCWKSSNLVNFNLGLSKDFLEIGSLERRRRRRSEFSLLL
jgi:hypothetical protein